MLNALVSHLLPSHGSDTKAPTVLPGDVAEKPDRPTKPANSFLSVLAGETARKNNFLAKTQASLSDEPPQLEVSEDIENPGEIESPDEKEPSIAGQTAETKPGENDESLKLPADGANEPNHTLTKNMINAPLGRVTTGDAPPSQDTGAPLVTSVSLAESLSEVPHVEPPRLKPQRDPAAQPVRSTAKQVSTPNHTMMKGPVTLALPEVGSTDSAEATNAPMTFEPDRKGPQISSGRQRETSLYHAANHSTQVAETVKAADTGLRTQLSSSTFAADAIPNSRVPATSPAQDADLHQPAALPASGAHILEATRQLQPAKVGQTTNLAQFGASRQTQIDSTVGHPKDISEPENVPPPLRTPLPTPPTIPAMAMAQSTTGLSTTHEVGGEAGRVRWISEMGSVFELGTSELSIVQRPQSSTLLPQPDLPRHISSQLAEAVRKGGGDRPMELTLNPAELGRVRISMQTTDGIVTVNVIAERPETLDLMRRHIDLLAQDFQDIGYGAAEFTFGQNTSDTQDDAGQSHATIQTAEPDQTDPSVIAAPLTIQTDRVDIRI